MNARQIIDEAIDPKRVLRSAGNPPEMRVGEEVCPATSNTGYIMQLTLDKLKELNPRDWEAEMTDDVQDYLNGNLPPDFDPEYYLYERLFPHMGLYCPPFTYFGSYEADGSIGCWPYGDDGMEEMVDRGKLQIVNANALDWGNIHLSAEFVLLDRPDGHKELWNAKYKNRIWAW